MDSTEVHPDLKPQYQRYKILTVGLVISSILPPVTFFIFYSTAAGLAHLSQHLLAVMVAFILEVPLMLALAHFLGLKRMKFLQRSTQLVRSGAKQELQLVGAYKFNAPDGNKGCVLELYTQDGVERFPVIPNKSIEGYIAGLSELPALAAIEDKPLGASAENVYGYVDPETKRPVAVEVNGNVLWISPPAKMF